MLHIVRRAKCMSVCTNDRLHYCVTHSTARAGVSAIEVSPRVLCGCLAYCSSSAPSSLSSPEIPLTSDSLDLLVPSTLHSRQYWCAAEPALLTITSGSFSKLDYVLVPMYNVTHLVIKLPHPRVMGVTDNHLWIFL